MPDKYILIDDSNYDTFDAMEIFARGVVRLWYDSEPPARSTKAVYITEGNVAGVGDKLNPSDLNQFGIKLSDLFTMLGLSMDDYGEALSRGFHADVKLPASIIDSYSG
jgi:hypothetical protein